MQRFDIMDAVGPPPRGTYNNPLRLDGPIPEEYPAEFKDRPYIYVQETDGQITKVYRSYADACD